MANPFQRKQMDDFGVPPRPSYVEHGALPEARRSAAKISWWIHEDFMGDIVQQGLVNVLIVHITQLLGMII